MWCFSGATTYLKVDEEIDRTARLQISTELGHNRVEITNAYLG